MSSINTTTTSRFLRIYADKEQWKLDHYEAQSCFDMEEKMEWGVRLFGVMLDLEARVQVLALKEQDSRMAEQLAMMPVLYQLWLEASEFYLDQAQKLMMSGHKLNKLDEFQSALEEARCLVGNLNLEEQILPFEALMSKAKPTNPRPERYIN